jgi:catechol O-methyltransferase
VRTECYAYVYKHATQGNPDSVIAAMDAFCNQPDQMLMNVGDDKGPIVESLLSEHLPRVMVELGCFMGYSAIRFTNHLKKQGVADIRYYSFEVSPEYARDARTLIAFAGLQDNITVMLGTIQELAASFSPMVPHGVDMFFIDHWKDLYLQDIQFIETTGLLHKGSVVVADNVICPGAPDYLAYIRSSAKYTTRFIPSFLEYSDKQIPDGLEVSVWQSQ